jgi:hypothetical protein
VNQAEAAPAAGEGVAETGPVRVLFIGGLGRSGSTLLDRMLGQLHGVWSVGELVHIWQRGLQENNLCGCGRRFRDCHFWRRVGEEAFGGWEALDVDEVLALKQAVDRNRCVPLMCLPALWPPYRARLRRYLDLLDRLYRAVRRVAGTPLLVDASKHASHAFLLRRMPGLDLRLVHLVRDSRGVAFSWGKLMRRREVVDAEALMDTNTPLRMSARYLAYNALFHLLDRLGVPTLLLRYEPRPRRQPHALRPRPRAAAARRGVARQDAPAPPPAHRRLDLAAPAPLRVPAWTPRAPLSGRGRRSAWWCPPATGRSCCAGP